MATGFGKHIRWEDSQACWPSTSSDITSIPMRLFRCDCSRYLFPDAVLQKSEKRKEERGEEKKRESASYRISDQCLSIQIQAFRAGFSLQFIWSAYTGCCYDYSTSKKTADWLTVCDSQEAVSQQSSGWSFEGLLSAAATLLFHSCPWHY